MEPTNHGAHTAANEGGALSRRRLFELTGAGVAMAAFLAACGHDEAPAPGRVGSAPSTTALPTLAVTNVVYLRTMASIEQTIITVYEQLSTIDTLEPAIAAAISRYIDDHRAVAAHLDELTRAAGGEPWQCTNPWWMDRLVQPSLNAIFGTADIPPSDDAARDAVSFVDVLEKVSAASYQLLVGSYSEASLRKESIKMGTAASQRSATIVLLSAGVPDGVVSPALLGGTVAPDAEGFTPAYAIDTRFGPLVPFQLQVGAPNDLGVRFKVNYETPSDNSYIYEGMTCEPGATSSEPPSASAAASQGSIAGSVPIATTSDTSPPGSPPGMSPGATDPASS